SGEISPTHIYEDVGTYDVSLSVTSPIGCMIDTLFRELVSVFPSPTAGFSFSPEEPSNIDNEVDFFDESIDAIAWSYTLGDLFSTNQPNFSFEFRDTGLVDITQIVTHPSGCTDTMIQQLNLQPIISIHVPNAFTPNGDGLNDIFIPKYDLFGFRGYEFNVWNRWGQRIFTTDDPSIGWDGRYKNADSPAGGYLWEITIINARFEAEKFKGSVVLLR
ncbi:MAG: gliding motility-associated C-terminal domain-containing protein, partial [Bacteroidota bacterium]